MADAAQRARRAWRRAQSFFASDVWSVPLAGLAKGRARLYRASRVLYSAYRGFGENRLTFRAAALTYYSTLSVVPFLAFAFSVLKGFGAYDRLTNEFLRPYVARTFGENQQLSQAMDVVLRFVERTDVSSLGTVGVAFLLYTSISLLSSIEETLNLIWGARTRRSLLRQITDYTTLLVTTPLFVLVATTIATAASSSSVVAWARDAWGIGPILNLLPRLTSVAFTFAAIFVLYILLPHVRARALSALLGAAIAAVAWQLALVLHVDFQSGVARYNALYASFAAVPIFLVWVYVSWTIVLAGAQLAASHQNEQTLRQTRRAREVDQRLRERLAIAVAGHIARAFVRGGAPPTESGLAETLAMPLPAVSQVVAALCERHIVVSTAAGGELAYVLARPPEQVRLSDVRDAVRNDIDRETLALADDLDRAVGRDLVRVFDAVERRMLEDDVNPDLRTVAERIGAAGPPEAPPEGGPSLDPKDPNLPS